MKKKQQRREKKETHEFAGAFVLIGNTLHNERMDGMRQANAHGRMKQ